MKNAKLMEQLRNNVETLVYEYGNGQTDCGKEEYPNMTGHQWFNYCVPDIYDMINDGCGCTRYINGICKELKFLGNEVIYNVIVDIADEEGLLMK